MRAWWTLLLVACGGGASPSADPSGASGDPDASDTLATLTVRGQRTPELATLPGRTVKLRSRDGQVIIEVDGSFWTMTDGRWLPGGERIWPERRWNLQTPPPTLVGQGTWALDLPSDASGLWSDEQGDAVIVAAVQGDALTVDVYRSLSPVRWVEQPLPDGTSVALPRPSAGGKATPAARITATLPAGVTWTGMAASSADVVVGGRGPDGVTLARLTHVVDLGADPR